MIVSRFSGCTSALAGTELEDEIYLVDADRHQSLVFKYEPNPGIIVPGMSGEESTKPASAIWVSEKNVQISMGAISAIEVQKTEANGVSFSYKIGAVMHPRS